MDKECSKAFANPKCPYLTQINQHSQDLQSIKRALLGEDGTGMAGGIVYEISCLKANSKVHSSWTGTFKPVFCSIVTATITAAVTYFVTH